ncbi:MAG: glycosyltransferase family 39 protein [Candidatus Omnitrophota bacterium]|nr:glycosyltransferase family 39 protein [Candidatus Omnitrophota bacterium]MDZ4243467.1 glycosyltransferase family 39 protein [Candidatus Omnitrophota bacterium]
MNLFHEQDPQRRAAGIGVFLLISFGVILRFWKVWQADFLFYDEGFYLNHNRLVGEILKHHFPATFGDFFHALYAYLRVCLATGKALWFLLVDSRIFFGAVEFWAFSRVLSAVFGALTLAMLYRFSRRYFASSSIAWLSVAILAVLPSHVFYSRIGLQEACSTFLVLAGFYFYLFPRGFSGRTFLSAVILAGGFFSNYRMIILPFLVAFTEGYFSLVEKRWPDVRKYVWHTVAFFAVVILTGSFHGGENTRIISAWLFHQAQMAEGSTDILNILSYPYYLFRLEHGLFGLLFFSSIFFFARRDWVAVFPFALACVQMLIFSFASEKGARYVCVMMPFMAAASAYALESFVRMAGGRLLLKAGLIGVSLLMFGCLGYKSLLIAASGSDYRSSMQWILSRSPQAKVASTQHWVQNLYVPNPSHVKELPHQFEGLLRLREQGFQYIVVCPQSYISWTDKDERFNTQLIGYLDFLSSRVKPEVVLKHFDDVMLERFVFEHNANLRRSIAFLRVARRYGLGTLRVYSLPAAVDGMLRAAAHHHQEGR